MQDLLSHAQRSTKAGHNAADGRDLHLPSRVAHQINRSVAHMAVHWNPSFVNGNARRLKFDGFEVWIFQEFLQMAARFRARLTDDSQSASGSRLRDEPLKIGSVLMLKPHSRRVSRHVFR